VGGNGTATDAKSSNKGLFLLSFVYSFFILSDLRRPHIEQTPTCEAIVATLSGCCCDGSGVASQLLLDLLASQISKSSTCGCRKSKFCQKIKKKIKQKISQSLVVTL